MGLTSLPSRPRAVQPALTNVVQIARSANQIKETSSPCRLEIFKSSNAERPRKLPRNLLHKVATALLVAMIRPGEDIKPRAALRNIRRGAGELGWFWGRGDEVVGWKVEVELDVDNPALWIGQFFYMTLAIRVAFHFLYDIRPSSRDAVKPILAQCSFPVFS
ncbi:hypothetical protein MMC12_001827 [Toensbergia leucococca]|nr:hypothetical protein [Toensbergia leucococca]